MSKRRKYPPRPRAQKAFMEGFWRGERRACPYQNTELARIWEKGRQAKRDGVKLPLYNPRARAQKGAGHFQRSRWKA